jgi:glyoxylase-like metal-dependent hydrolase (beta-lactamase superfamily II)
MSLFRPDDRVLIIGDALVTVQVNSLTGLLLQRPGLAGPPWYTTWNLTASRESIERLARYRPNVLATGHGRAMVGAGTAQALEAFAMSSNRGRRPERRGGRSDSATAGRADGGGP